MATQNLAGEQQQLAHSLRARHVGEALDRNIHYWLGLHPQPDLHRARLCEGRRLFNSSYLQSQSLRFSEIFHLQQARLRRAPWRGRSRWIGCGELYFRSMANAVAGVHHVCEI